jgi:hypothetical protein
MRPPAATDQASSGVAGDPGRGAAPGFAGTSCASSESASGVKACAERTRSAIRLPELVVALEDHAFGKIEMTPSQIRVAEVLLRKVLPDLPTRPEPDESAAGFKVEIIEPQT